MDYKKIFADLLCLQDKSHVYHIRTVAMKECATLHSAFGEVYNTLQDLTDSFGENVVQKYMMEIVPSNGECYKKSDFATADATDRDTMLQELYDDIDVLKAIFEDENNKANNSLAQLLGQYREKLTDLCALLDREMCDDDQEDDTNKETPDYTKNPLIKK